MGADLTPTWPFAVNPARFRLSARGHALWGGSLLEQGNRGSGPSPVDERLNRSRW